MKQRSLLSRVLTAMLGMLGFAGCDGVGNNEDMYGSPIVEFQVKGTVLSPDEKPVEGVRVIVRTEWDNLPWNADTVHTNAKGEFESRELSSVGIDRQMVYFEDVDGEANGGTFKADSVLLQDMKKEQLKEGSGWNLGKYRYSVVQKLKKADKEQKE